MAAEAPAAERGPKLRLFLRLRGAHMWIAVQQRDDCRDRDKADGYAAQSFWGRTFAACRFRTDARFWI